LQLHASHSQIQSRVQSADVLRVRGGGATYDSAIGDMTPKVITPRVSQTTRESRESRDIEDETPVRDTNDDHVHIQECDRDQDGRASLNTKNHTRAESATTMINPQEALYDAEEGEIVPALSDAGDTPVTPVTGPGERRYQPRYQEGVDIDEGDDEFVGPKLLPATPIMRFAMRVVVGDYYVGDDGASEYASLSDVNEY